MPGVRTLLALWSETLIAHMVLIIASYAHIAESRQPLYLVNLDRNEDVNARKCYGWTR